jgi:hypothetical protein
MPSVAQQAGAGGSAPTTGGDPAQVKFLFDWNQGRPWLSYSILVSSDGKAHFDGDPNPVEGGGDEPFQQDFRVSDANRQKIFDLAKRLNYFNGNFDFSKKIAQTGKKTLEYQSAGVRGSTTYNWSENKDVEELTRFFQSIATTLDYGCKLAFQYRFDKLGMDQRVRELEELQAKGDVEELAAIQPILQKIADDPSIMHISRQSAKHLLKSIHGPLPAAAAPSADTPPQPRSAEPE